MVRYRDSSKAEFPPPITTTSLSLKKAPSHTAQNETPRPMFSFSPGIFNKRSFVPVATITAFASTTVPSLKYTFLSASTFSTSPYSYMAPKLVACSSIDIARSVPASVLTPG